mmetsp:Transcript_95614/g.227761  ORF Transcript_95614/g.227761 Transcript_95614/m.227761 type:complete len:278 (+) Transcript_95614:103-936(+)
MAFVDSAPLERFRLPSLLLLRRPRRLARGFPGAGGGDHPVTVPRGARAARSPSKPAVADLLRSVPCLAGLSHQPGHGALLGGHRLAAPDARGVVRRGELLRDLLQGLTGPQVRGYNEIPALHRTSHEPLPRQRAGGDRRRGGGLLRDHRPHGPGLWHPGASQGLPAGLQVQSGRGLAAHDPVADRPELGERSAEGAAAHPVAGVPDAVPGLREPSERQEDRGHPVPFSLRAAHQWAADSARGDPPDPHLCHSFRGVAGLHPDLPPHFFHVLPQLHWG